VGTVLVSLTEAAIRGLRNVAGLAIFVWLREKTFSMDYETMENPEVAEKIAFSEKTSDAYGSLGMVLARYRDIFQAVLSVILSTSMVIWLCLTRPVGSGTFLERLAGPLPSLLLFGCALAGMAFFSGKVFVKFSEKQKAYFEANTGMEMREDYLLNQVFLNEKAGKVIRLYGMQDMLMGNAEAEVKKSKAYWGGMFDVMRRTIQANNGLNSLFTIGSYLLVTVKVVTKAITVGAFTQYVGALNQFGNACFIIINCQVRLRNVCTYMEKFLAFLDMEGGHVKGTRALEERKDGAYELVFEDVSFRYPGSRDYVLKHIDCRLNIRGRMALVGPNGAGKTTFIKLLCRLYEPTEGRITLNGVDIREYDEEAYRALFSVVFQDFKLLAFPVWENITAGFERDDDKIWKALEQADAADIVKRMPKQLDTYLYKYLEDGVEISGGEAQKIALARALYKDAPVVILDEPTAALDPVAEAEVYSRFQEMVEGKTGIYISHRMSSCQFCDEILVFHEGEIIERGSHEKLHALGGKYTELWDAQARYYA
jgi:ATP-binding cassette subfamily B protein